VSTLRVRRSDPAQRANRAAKFAASHGLDAPIGSGRYVAVVLAPRGKRLLQADHVDDRFDADEVLALVNLDHSRL